MRCVFVCFDFECDICLMFLFCVVDVGDDYVFRNFFILLKK